VIVKTFVSLPDQLAIKSLFASARFVAAHEKYRAPLRVEGKSDSPYTARGTSFYVAYMSPMNFRPLYPDFDSEIGEKSAPVVGLNDVFGSF
jgi:hypothetical protein